MRILDRDKEIVYFAKYYDKSEIIKNGKRTGEYQLAYSAPFKAKVYVSTTMPKNTGKSELQPSGNVTHYLRTIVSEADLGLDINDLFWIGTPQPFNSAVEVQYYTNAVRDGGYMWMWSGARDIDEGTILPWSVTAEENGNINQAPNYKIVTVGKSKHHVVYGVQQL